MTTQPQQQISLEVGNYYEVDYKKGRVVLLYQGQDMGRSYTFVGPKLLFRVAESQINNINPILKTDHAQN